MNPTKELKIVVLFLPLLLLLSACSKDENNNNFLGLKKTGQLKSYDANAQEIIDKTLKDDAYYKKGLDSNYTVLSKVVVDEVNGLVWQNDADVGSVVKPWLSAENFIFCTEKTDTFSCDNTAGDTAVEYCFNLILENHTDWRLPTLEELDTLVDYGKYAPAIESAYFNANDANYSFWSASTYQSGEYGTGDKAWSLSFVDGSDSYDFKNSALHVRCVRGR